MFKPTPDSKPAPAPLPARPGLPVWLLAVLLALATITLYWPVTHHDFLNYDDNQYVLENPHVNSGLTLGNAWWALGSGYAANWHPVTWLSHMVDCQLFGLHPWGHHLTNVLLHALNAALVLVLLQQLTGAVWRSLLVAALFALHPLRVESVAWVAERKDVLSACFGLLALVCYARYVRVESSASRITHHASRFTPPHPRASTFYLLSLLFFSLGLMSKPMLVTWPFVMLLLDYWPLSRFQPSTSNAWLSPLKPLIIEKIPFFILSAAACVVTFAVQQSAGAVRTIERLSLGARAGNAVISYCRYLARMFWPTDLAVFYPMPSHWPLAEVLLAGGLIFGLSAMLFMVRGRYPFLLIGWLWFVGTLVPVIGLAQVGDQSMADRYSYIPSLGVLILTIWGAHEFTRRWRYQVLALSVGGVTAIVLCFALTRRQLGYWQDSETLFRQALAVTKDNYIALNCLGVALDNKGQFDEAIDQYQEAIRLKPNDPLARNNLGVAFLKKGQTDEAIRQFQEALRLKPDDADAHYHLGNALVKKGQMDEAIRHFREALRLKPDDAAACNNLGNALARKGQIDEAVSLLQQALRLKPDETDAHYNLGNALVRKGQIDEAITQYQAALQLKPDDPDTHNNLGVALYRKRRNEEAISQFQEALRLKPEYADARRNLNVALAARAGSSQPPGASTRP